MFRIRSLILTLFCLVLGATLSLAQGGQSGGGSTGGSTGTGSSTGGAGTSRPTTTTPPRQPTPDRQVQEMPIFLSGRVVTEDGVPPPDRAVIERVCSGQIRREGYTDSKGYFSIQLGTNFSGVIQDATVGASDSFSTVPGSRTQGTSGVFGTTSSALMGCELRASLPGYRSDAITLAGRRPLDHPEVGVIVLHPYGKVEGTVISATSLQAPKNAKKALDKARDYAKKSKWNEAEQELRKAVELYPKYADAWYELGMVYQRQGRKDDAHKAYDEAVAADSKFIRPYFGLAQLAAGQNNWQQVAALTDKVLALNAYEYPVAYFYNSVAYYNLRQLDQAERSARSAKRLDSQHRIPNIDLLLGNILMERRDYAGAAEMLRSYLKLAPEASDTAGARTQLENIEKILGNNSQAAPPK